MVAINRAIESCQSTGIEVTDQFREVTKLIVHGKGGKRGAKNEQKKLAQKAGKLPEKGEAD